jgi:GT2 family glycosyltransferase
MERMRMKKNTGPAKSSGGRPDISIVLLNYNTRELTMKAIETVYDSDMGPYTLEVILCDNASTDDIEPDVKKRFPDVLFIQNGGNVGFAGGNNPGIEKSRGRYVLLLNTDTEVAKTTLATMIKYMDDHADVGASTCKLLLMDGTIDPACHRGFPTPWAACAYYAGLERLFPNNRLFGGYHLTYLDKSTIHEVDMISGAFLLIRRSVLTQIGLLDTDYLMYGEDMDWCIRIRRAGWKIIYNPTVTILHKKKQSGRANADRARRIRTEGMFFTYNKLFYKKNYDATYPKIVMWLVYTLFDLRILFLQTFGR